jgi:hypothetical protein
MVAVAHARVDPGTVVVHLHDTSIIHREEYMTINSWPL